MAGEPGVPDQVDQFGQAALVHVVPVEDLGQDAGERLVRLHDGVHRGVDDLARVAALGLLGQHVPAGVLRHPEHAFALVLVHVVEERLDPRLGHAVGEHIGADLLAALGEGVGHVLEEHHARARSPCTGPRPSSRGACRRPSTACRAGRVVLVMPGSVTWSCFFRGGMALLLAYLNGRRLGEGKRPIDEPGHGDIPQFGDQVELLAGRLLAGIERGEELIQELHLGGAEHGHLVVFQPPGRADRARPGAGSAAARPAAPARVRGVKDCRSVAGIRSTLAGNSTTASPAWSTITPNSGVVVTITSPGSVRWARGSPASATRSIRRSPRRAWPSTSGTPMTSWWPSLADLATPRSLRARQDPQPPSLRQRADRLGGR